MGETPSWQDIHYRVRDGLRLYARRYPACRATASRPVVCLPGLTRNSRDFHDLAVALARHPVAPRTVYALDYRGRGLSDYDRDWKGYTVPNEAQDVLDFVARENLHGAGFIGTSRGGLITMVLSALQPSAVGTVVLNDIGPVIEREGLVRIASYLGRVALPKTWDEAAAVVAAASRRQFPDVPDSVWPEIARQWFNVKDGRPAPGYDPALRRTFALSDEAPPPLWPQFAALVGRPLLIIRGEMSDLLSQATVDTMLARHRGSRALVVRGQGHAPFLKDTPSIEAVAAFLADAERVAVAA